ncbi:serine hydrolase domain-containing protein [Psychroserpens algicola]|uniref:Beta-lactamase family protein n=1 Tax=Psychroserpens algicola TaxID=1719034 RepID=A0ABT0H5J4_9FLAO|nr:serine hydrolase [Psychroserpens algicola]MCK8479631.1 beta-lactamase family protein [Psychroserpens algicola]
MKPIYFISFFVCCMFFFTCSSDDTQTPEEQQEEEEQEQQPETIYFPSLDTTALWETKSIADLEWNTSELQPLLDFLEEKNTKSFIVLHHGKIVIETYMNGHNDTSPWYWASAGKTLTATITGIAQDEGYLDINAKVSDYLGTGWTSATLNQENLITSKHLLSMTSGLDDTTGDGVSSDNLQYIADAGTRWAYHNVYVKLQDIVAQSTNNTWDAYFDTKLKSKIGMSGSWIPLNDLNVYWSNTRSMARFGLLIYANGKWEDQQIVSESYITAATNTSQDINLAYGYLWWLNGKSSYHLPQSQFEFQGELTPNAPADMFAALGKNDQKIYVVPSKKLVVIRMGEAADDSNFALSNFDNELWEKISSLTN